MNSLKSELDRIDNEIKKHKALLNDPELSSLAQEEIKKLEGQKQALKQGLQSIKSNKKQINESNFDQNNAILETRPGTGGEEAKIFSDDLLRMYSRHAQLKSFKIENLDERVIKIIGKNAYGAFKYESGVHRVQRVPATESQGRIHTSTASVAVLPEIKPQQFEVKEDELEWTFSRAGGHGGQNVNKVNSAVRLIHKPTNTIVSCRQERSQVQNKAIALDLLRAKLWEKQEEERIKTIEDKRKAAVGRAMRAEKIRTYNYPQNRVTDHRINKSWYDLENILDGNLDKVTQTIKNTLLN